MAVFVLSFSLFCDKISDFRENAFTFFEKSAMLLLAFYRLAFIGVENEHCKNKGHIPS